MTTSIFADGIDRRFDLISDNWIGQLLIEIGPVKSIGTAFVVRFSNASWGNNSINDTLLNLCKGTGLKEAFQLPRKQYNIANNKVFLMTAAHCVCAKKTPGKLDRVYATKLTLLLGKK